MTLPEQRTQQAAQPQTPVAIGEPHLRLFTRPPTEGLLRTLRTS